MDIDSPYAVRPRGTLFPVGSYGHTGFTGCVLWIDPGSRSFYVLLSNRGLPRRQEQCAGRYLYSI
jgi:CubicO group peptidase (beta-lactamase class C family)